MSDTPELARVLGELEWLAPQLILAGEERRAALCAAAASLLREMARDFGRYADHISGPDRPNYYCNHVECDCGLDAARERWRLPK